MRKSQELTVKLSEHRESLNDAIEERNKLEDGTEPSAELLAKIDSATKAVRACEVELRAAITAEAAEDEEHREEEPDAEARALIRLEERASLGRFVQRSIMGKPFDGAELEFSQALKLADDQVPLQLFIGRNFEGLEERSEPGKVEERTTTDTDIATRPRRWVDRLFAGTAAQALGLTFDSAQPGTQAYPITTAGGTPAQRGREEAAVAGAWTIGVKSFDNARMSIRYEFALEDANRVPGLEAALQRDMRMALRERVDHAIFAGATGADEDRADITGFFSQADVVAETLTQANKVKADKTIEELAGLIDGIHAERAGDLRIVASVPWNQLAMSTIANSAAENQTLAQFLMASGINWRTRAGIGATTAAGQNVMAIGRGRGIMGAGVVIMWPGAMLIRDQYTKAAEGAVALTLHTFWNWGLVRPSSFAKVTAAA